LFWNQPSAASPFIGAWTAWFGLGDERGIVARSAVVSSG
jgi:hypothetical protein